MRKIIRFTKSQSAQGMVEFALVLPVLMLIILGVFAFGHMFFAYSSVVSASREAARWGAAVGLSTGPYPRYKDCDAIRDAAVRVGSFAGVTPASVTITYDNGPSDTTNPKPDCPVAAGSQGPNVALGNRINVNVTVQYKPIVPLLQLPTFPLTATTSRTILLALPVGEVPTANSIYPTTTLNVTVNGSPVVLSNPGSSSIVGQIFTIAVTVTSSDSTIPTGKISIGDDSLPQQLCSQLTLDATGSASCSTFVYHTSTTDPVTHVNKPHLLGIVYDPYGAHYNPSTVNVTHTVAPASSTTTITSITPTDSAAPGQTVTVVAHVAPQFSGVPTGKTELRLADQSVAAFGNLDANGNISLSFIPSSLGGTTLTVYYLGDANFTPSTSPNPPYLFKSLDVIVTPRTTAGTTGVPVNLIVSVTSKDGTGGIPTGTVLINGTNTTLTCSATLNGSGVASCPLTFATAGSYDMAANFQSGNLTFANGSAAFTLTISDKISTSIALSPAGPTIIKPSTPMTFNVTVTQADGKLPIGAVNVIGSNGMSCNITLTNAAAGSCTISGLGLGGPYNFVATFNPTDSTTYSSSLSNNASVTVASNCPKADTMVYSGNTIKFNVYNTSPNNVNLNVTQAVVTWDNLVVNALNDIRFIDSVNLAGACAQPGLNVACLWEHKNKTYSPGGIINPSTPSGTFWDSSIQIINAGATKVFQLDFASSIDSKSNPSVVITFDQGCSLTVNK